MTRPEIAPPAPTRARAWATAAATGWLVAACALSALAPPAPAWAADANPVPATSAAPSVGQTTLDARGLAIVLSYPSTSPEQPLQRGEFSIRVATDGVPAAGRFPLVVISHGTRGSAIADHALAERLVRAGFAVAQPLHRGDHFADASMDAMESQKRRPGEISETIDALAAHPQWSQRLKLDRVGVHGMSAGGATALSMAGGQWRMLELIRHCNTHREDDAGFCFQGAADPAVRAARSASFDRARGVPEEYLPAALKQWHGGRDPAAPGSGAGADPRPDARVAAVSVAVPVVAIFTSESLQRIRVPLGVVRAEADQMLLPRWHSDRLLAEVPGAVLLATLKGGGHFDVLAPWPPGIAQQVGAGQVRGGLPQPGFDPAEREAAQQRIVAFHRRHLVDQAPAP